MQWKSSLTTDEKAMLLRQTHGEFNKKYRKTDEFDQDLPQEKVEALGKALEKYFDSEAEDYVKQRDSKVPDYDRIKRKCALKAYDWSMTNTIVEVDRNAFRLNDIYDDKVEEAKEKGEPVPIAGSPMKEWFTVNDNTGKAHEFNVMFYNAVKEKVTKSINEAKDLKAETKKALLEGLEKSAPPAEGHEWQLVGFFILNRQFEKAIDIVMNEYRTKLVSEGADKEKLPKEVIELAGKVGGELTKGYYKEQSELLAAAKKMRDIARSEKYEEGKKRSDVAKKLHADMTAYNKEQKKDPPPPLDEEYLAELDKTPLPKPGDPEFQNPWNTADTLYKSEAYDSFGQKYLLGLFETQEEAHEVFKKWNDEFTEGRAKLKEEVIQWGKQQQAILDKDPDAQERIKKAVEEAKR